VGEKGKTTTKTSRTKTAFESKEKMNLLAL